MTMSETDLDFALRLAHHAVRIIGSTDRITQTTKADGTPVTSADLAVHQMVAAAVDGHGDLLLSEEGESSSRYRRTGARTWVCDPMDGSWLGRAAGLLPVFSLALVEKGRPQVAVVGDPASGAVTAAIRGNGTFTVGGGQATLKVSTRRSIQGACVALTASFSRQLEAGALVRDLIDFWGADVISTGSAVRDLLQVAHGFADGAVYPYTSPWDVAAAALLVTEAGGVATDLAGRALDLDGPIDGAVLSTPWVHDELLELVGRARPRGRS